jgi:hypothetical protein
MYHSTYKLDKSLTKGPGSAEHPSQSQGQQRFIPKEPVRIPVTYL